jgi:hypothetical protein
MKSRRRNPADQRRIGASLVSGSSRLRSQEPGTAQALGALALGALAVGAVAIGALAIGRLAIGRARIGRLEIDELVVRQLRVTEDFQFPPTPDPDS